jgi:hypothetical protein
VSTLNRSPRVGRSQNPATNNNHSHVTSVLHWSRPIKNMEANTA